MGKLDIAAEGLVNLATQIQPLFEVADALKGLGSLEQATAERKKALADLTANHEALKKEAADASVSLNKTKTDQASELSRHQDQLKHLQSEAQQQASTIVERATRDATKIIQDAKDAALQSQKVADDAHAKASAELVRINDAIQVAQGKLSSISQQVTDKQAQFDQLQQTAAKIAAGA